MGRTGVEWATDSWNPVRGCTKVSPGCRLCYAETFAERFRGVPGHPYEQGFDLRLVPEALGEPLKWRKPRMVFVNSMSDLFHEDVPHEYIDRVFDTMSRSSQHIFQVLTKRPERMRLYMAPYVRPKVEFHNVWLGVSVEDRRHGVPRIDVLRKTKAALRFLSIEPLHEDLGVLDLTGIGWVIVGGESGDRRAQPLHVSWVTSIRDQCIEAGVPFFFKQWGHWSPRPTRHCGDPVLVCPDGRRVEPGAFKADLSKMWPTGKKKAGRSLEGKTWDQMPEMAQEERR